MIRCFASDLDHEKERKGVYFLRFLDFIVLAVQSFSRDEQPEPPSSLDGYSPHEAPQELAFLQASKLYHQDFIINIYSSFMCKGRAFKN